MDLLKALEAIRTPFLSDLFSVLTYLGAKEVMIVVGFTTLWCIDKRWGYRICYVGMAGTIFNQWLKVIFSIPRPWVQDPGFTIVESAREAADGYSFPSGHTQTAASLFGTIATAAKRRKGAAALCAILILLTAFSRVYLGVHTLLDVGVSLFSGLLTVAVLTLLFERAKNNRTVDLWLWIGLLAFVLAELFYVLLAPKPPSAIPEFELESLENAFTMTGTVLGMLLIRFVDRRYLKFETRAVWWIQIIKCFFGFALLLLIMVLTKTPFLLLFKGHSVSNLFRYFLVVASGGILWPMTFPLLSRLGAKAKPPV
ncbi:MAG: phosphatase PAP2 family protein [Bacillota bacterium]